MCDSFSDGLRESEQEGIPENSVEVNKGPTTVREADGFCQIRGRVFTHVIRASVAVCRSALSVDQGPKGR
jgi:hypothetical protein